MSVSSRPAVQELAPPGAAFDDGLRRAVRELWTYRDLLQQITLRDVRIRYKQAVMGFAWAILMPALIVAAGTLVRAAMAHVGNRELDLREVAGVAVKALPWAFFVGTLGFATNSLTGNMNLVTKVYFPRAVLPLASALAQCVDTAVGTATVALALLFLGATLSPALLWVPVIALLVFLFTVGVSFVVSCANLFFRDVKYLVQVMLTFGIFFTPVFFEPATFGELGAKILMANPLAPLLEGLRLAVVEGHPLLETLRDADGVLVWSPWHLAWSAVWAVGVAVGGLAVFRRLEHVFAEYV